MKYTLEQNLHSRKGVSSNLHGFIERYMDTGFKSKWSGYWSPPYKFLDYYAFKINGVWLGPETLNATEYGSSFAFHHETDSLNIRENLKTPDSHPGFKTELKIHNKTDEKKAVQIGLETAVDIRRKDEDIGPANYSVEKNSNRLLISSNNKKLMIRSKESFEIRGEDRLKEHHPGERQRAFIPGQIIFRKKIEPHDSESIEIDFSTSEASFESIEKSSSNLEGNLSRTFNSSIDSMENLIYDINEKGIIAGHPWFQSYWARDSFISLFGLIDAGHFEISKQILESFADNQLTGKINPDNTTEKVGREDHFPLFVITSKKLEETYSITDKIEEARKEAMKRLEVEDGLVQHNPEGTWMDTLERGNAIEIQSLWLEATKITGDPRQKELEEGLEKFIADGKVLDELENPKNTFNILVPVIFGHFNEDVAEKVMERINGEFTSQYGIRTRSGIDPGYEADGYHTGSVWGLTTGLGAAANFKIGKYQQGLNLLEKMAGFLDRNQVGALPEIVDAESGELLGCSEQAWSAAMFVHAVDSYMLGIEPGEEININPSGRFNATRKGKRVGEKIYDIKFSDGDFEVLDRKEDKE